MAENAAPPDDARQGRLLARPLSPHEPPAAPGLHALGLAGAGGRDGLVYVPAGYDATRPAPLALLLHGASHDADTVLAPLLPWADAAGLLLLAPNARQFTWDVIRGGFGPDVAFIDGALAYVFARYAVDPTRLAIGGFSDGASYALSLGLTNGDLFTHIIAFSPGFVAPGERRGQPCIFVSHGVHDQILPIDRCGRRLVQVLQHAGYDVDYHEFDGPHTVPPEIASGAVTWLTR
ncbi:MAG TPA: alpha/beta hydrolase-fold protein [Ktedonobacterales bacterium]